jgi:probable rRNA maturation factor
MQKLNKKFRNKNKSTDVLSFPNFSYKNLQFTKNKNIYIGDIAVSFTNINKNLKNNNFLFEFDKVWIHGFLHLLGYDHIKNKDYFRMQRIEKKLINKIY